MARKREGIDGDHDLVGGLPNPYPSAPHRLPTHGIKITCSGRSFSTAFSACYAAKHFVNLIIKDGYKRASDTKLRSEDWVIVESPELNEILRHKFTPAERRWEIPDHYKWQAFYVATGRRLNLKRSPSYEISPYSQEIRRSQRSQEISRDRRSQRSLEEKNPEVPLSHPHRVSGMGVGRKSGTKGKSPDGKISLSEICSEIGMETSRARRILRSRSDLSHMRQGRWEWDDRDAQAIKEILRK